MDHKPKNKREEPCCSRPDHPKVGDSVAVIREEHGWHDGNVSGTVTRVGHRGTGGVSYTVRVDDDSDYSGCDFECGSRGDVRLLRRA